MNVLIVEDNALVRRMIREMLSGLKADIHECANGAEAMISYARHRPDWVLMDIEMPVCDGIAATKHIKESFAEAKVIICTSHDSPRLRLSAREAGAYAYVLKDDLIHLREMLADSENADGKRL